MQNEEKNTVCKLCLNYCECSFEDGEAVTKEMLPFLGLELNLNSSERAIICKTCSANLQKCVDFKTVCMNTEGCISSFGGDADDVKFDLTDVYLRKNGNEHIAVSKCRIICRLCMEITDSDCCLALDGETNDVISAKTILGTWFSELKLDITKNPVICTSCNESLHCYFNFIKSCYGIEDKVEMYRETEGSDNKLHVKSNSMLPFEAEIASSYLNNDTNIAIPKDSKDIDLHAKIKLELDNQVQKEFVEFYVKHEIIEHEENNDVKLETFSDIADKYCEEEQNGVTFLKDENLVGRESYGFNFDNEEIDIKTEEQNPGRAQDNSLKVDMLINKETSDVTVHLCEICTYKTRRKYNLKLHMLIHKNSSEVTMYSCEVCAHKTKRRDNLTRHMLIHKNSSEVIMYSCEICEYKAKRKYHLQQHMLIHKNSSEVTMYSCEVCGHKTKRSYDLKLHMLIHKNILEATIYSCEKCTYKTKQKKCLKSHMLIHGNASEVTMYSCEVCAYKAKRKSSLKQHILIHKDACEVTTYSCNICTYKTFQKNHFKRHTLIHKNSSEITMYACEICAHKTKQKHHLKEHMLVHKNEHETTMYSCGKCAYKTKRERYLKYHMLIHKNSSEVTMYSCDICAYRTKQKVCLKRHMLTHRNSSIRKTSRKRHTETKEPSETVYVDPKIV